jgi:K+-sensing histidine kinase KdpD
MQKAFLPRTAAVFAASLAALATIAFLDYQASNELVVDQFFLLPVAIAAWFGGKWPCWIMAVASSIVWLLINRLNVPVYLHPHHRYWNWALILFRILVAGTFVALLRDALASAKKNLAEKEAALLSLQQSTAEIRAYEGQFQTICTWTNQIKDGEEWVSFPVFLARHLHSRITHGISPAGAARLGAGLKRDSSPPTS